MAPRDESTRVIRYRAIAEDLRGRITDGELAGGALLPSESELSARYSSSRVTIRRALEALRQDGLVDSRQGFGWYVATDPLRQSLGRLGTLEGQLAAAGIRSERHILAFGFVAPPPRVAEVLGVGAALEVRRGNIADGQPFALGTGWCPESLGAHLSRADVERSSFLEQLPVVLGGATQTIGAALADRATAEALDIVEGAPVLVAERITRDADGDAVLVSRHVFPAHRTEFAVELAAADDALAPTGLRLVE